MGKPLNVLALVAGILLLIAGAVYFTNPANSLPGFMPGYDPNLAKIHKTHALGSFVLGLACFAFVWFNSKKPSSKEEDSGSQTEE